MDRRNDCQVKNAKSRSFNEDKEIVLSLIFSMKNKKKKIELWI